MLPSKNVLEKNNKRFNQMLKNGALQGKKYKKIFRTSIYISANSIIGIYEIGLYLDKSINIKDLREFL